MLNRPIKVSFEVTDNWAKGEFRAFVRDLLKNTDLYNVYIISNDNSTSYIQSIGQILENEFPEAMNSSKVIVVNFTSDKITAITNNKIDIHLDDLLTTTTLVDETTDAYGIFVNELPNKYELKPSYIVEFGRVVERLNNEQIT